MKNKLLILFLSIAYLIAQPWQPAAAATLTVNALDDTDDGSCNATHCSLREAILYANPGDTLNFSVTGTIMLAGTQLTIDKSLTIAGPGKDLLTVSANTTSPSKGSRVFYLYAQASNLNVAISGLSITNGSLGNGFGGGIYNEGEYLTITNCLISGHTAKDGGGAIYNSGTMKVSRSTISDNTSAGGPGGGFYNEGTLDIDSSTVSGNSAANGPGGGAINYGTMTVDNSTFFENHADSNRYWGGGIGNYGTLSVTNSTISANSADLTGAGLRHKGDSLTLSNTIIANNTGAGDCQSDTPIIDGGYNLIEGSGGDACDLTNGVNGNLIGLDPALADELGDYGGPTLTLAIRFSGSPAWDAIPNGVNGCTAGVSLDQRGEVRAGGSASTGYAACDIGAFEYGSGLSPVTFKTFLPLALRDN